MADILGKDLDKLEDSLATRQPFNLTESDVTGPQFMTGSDFVRSAKVTPDWKMPVAIPSQASGSTYKIAQPFITGGQALFNVFADYLPNMANLSAQYAMELTGKKKEPEDFITKLRKGTEIGGLYYDVARVLGMGMLGADAIANRKEYEEKAKTYDELVELLDNREYPLTKYARRVLANTTDDVETRHLVQEMYNQSRGIDSSKWYNQAGSIIGAMIPTITVARGAGATARAFGASRANAVNTAQNVAKGFIGGQMAGEYAEQTAADYLKRTGDKTFSNFTAEDAHGLSAMAIGAINAQIEFLGGVESIATGAVSKIGLRSSLGKAGLKTGLGEMGEEWLQDWTEFLGRKIDGTTDKTWGEEFKDSVSAAVWGLFIGGPMGAAAFYTNRRNLVKGIKQAMPNISDTQAENVADAMIDNVAEASSQDPTLRKSLRDKVSMMYETSDIDNKEDTIDAITDLEYSLIVADSAERGIEIADNPIFQGEVNELGWFREGIPEERRTEIQGYINELNDLKTELKKLNEAQEKDWAKIDEIENKLDKFNRYMLDKLSDLARADARQVAKILNETEQRFVNKEKKKKGVKVPVMLSYQNQFVQEQRRVPTAEEQTQAWKKAEEITKNILENVSDEEKALSKKTGSITIQGKNGTIYSPIKSKGDVFIELIPQKDDITGTWVLKYNTYARETSPQSFSAYGGEFTMGSSGFGNYVHLETKENIETAIKQIADIYGKDNMFFSPEYTDEQFSNYVKEYKKPELLDYKNQEIRDLVNQLYTSEQLFQEQFDLADENARLDDIYPAYDGETIEVDGKERTVYNSNGDRIAKSKEALTNFWKWFGDSKVVDKKGRPLVVYHGTNIEFDKFDINKAGLTTEAESALYGFYFTDSQGIAYSYANIARPEEIIKLKKEYERLEKIAQRTGKSSDWDAYQKVYLKYEEAELNYKPTEKVYNVYLKIENPIEYDFAGKYWEEGKYLEVIMDAKNNNNDGVIFRNSIDDPIGDRVSDIYVAFEPNQIKSVDNRGTYSADTGNIYWQSAYAGSRADYDKPSLEAIGSGEGNQAHGWGLYYALNPAIAEQYRAKLTAGISSVEYDGKTYTEKDGFQYQTLKYLANSNLGFDESKQIILRNLNNDINNGWIGKDLGNLVYKKFVDSITPEKIKSAKVNQNIGQVHEVDIPEMDVLLDEQKMLIDQPQHVQDAIQKINTELNLGIVDSGIRGDAIYNKISDKLGSDEKASKLLDKYGIKGITYFGRVDGRCFVIFNPESVKVLRKKFDELGNVLFQNRVSGAAPSTYRGAYIPEYRFILRANRMDASTLSHELAHDWFEVNFARYRSGKATKDFMRAWGALEKALGVEENAKVPPRKASEAFARAYEGWIMNKTDWEKLIAVEDKDKDAIVKLMQDYQNNLRDIYQDLTSPYFKQTWGKLGELKPELVQWFDRMVNITDLDILAERGEISQEQANQEKLNRAIDTVIENTTDPEGKKQLEYARTLNDTQRYEVEGGNKNALQRRIGALAQAIDENNMLIKENYDTRRDMLEVARQADNFVRTRLDDALAIINGQMAEQEGLFREDIYTALERLALENGDLGLLDELKNSEIANRLAKELGQRVAGFRNWNAGEVDVASAIKTLDNRFNKALQNKKAQVQLNEAESMFKKAQEQQDKLADKKLESILNELRCK
jgi:hypothetical protein